ncbi:hypothetical protein [Desulfosudis oleivorans]|uniref:hypothetical protein n=1 Tax=Desulfosudis oleivorans TaxID=181663 RepID=UPI00129487CE|nr:hypothetical protein [Desulfosudis oleivorans]
MVSPARCSAAERGRFFQEQAGRLSEFTAGERVPARAEKSVCAREATPVAWRARGQAAGHVSFGTFLCAKEKYTEKQEKKNNR